MQAHRLSLHLIIVGSYFGTGPYLSTFDFLLSTDNKLRRQLFISHPEQLIAVFKAAGLKAFFEPVCSLC